MQGIDDFLIALHQRGVELSAAGGRLCVEAAEGILLPEELNRLTALKSEILTRLDQIELTANAPLRRREPGQSIPLTTAQTLWWHGPLARGARRSTRICASAVRIAGVLNIDVLQQCLHSVLRRHESLRTNIHLLDGVPTPQVNPSGELCFEVEDQKARSLAVHDDGLMELIKEFVARPIDIAVEPLFGAKLFKLGGDDHVLVLAADHIVADATSVRIIERELWALYDHETAGRPLCLDDVAVQFADYAIWQQRIRPAWFFEHAAYWRQRMAGAPRPQLPIGDVPRAMLPMGAVATVPFTAAVSTLLREMARRERTLVPLLVLTIYAAVMARWCRRPDLLMTMVVDGRHQPQLQGMVGDFAYHLHLRLEVADGVSFHDLLRQVTAEYGEACRHEDFGWVPSFVPECRDSFVNVDWYFNWVTSQAAGPASAAHGQPGDVRRSKLPLQFKGPMRFLPYFVDDGEHILAVLRYGPGLFAPGEIERLGRNLTRFAAALVDHPHRPVPEYQG